MSIDDFWSRNISRRQLLKSSFLIYLSASLGHWGCRRRQYLRAAEKCWIGPPENFFFPAQPAFEAALLIKRDAAGWSALDGRCTVEGCDMSFNGEILLCPCCRSAFDLTGKILSPPAQDPLKHWRMGLENNSLIVFAGDQVASDIRFISPELEAKIKEMEENFKATGMVSITKPDADIVDPRRRPDANQLISDAELDAKKMEKIMRSVKKTESGEKPSR